MYKCSACHKIYKRVPAKVASFGNPDNAFFCRKCSKKDWNLIWDSRREIELKCRGIDLSEAVVADTVRDSHINIIYDIYNIRSR
jgi:hypothetical protein